MFNLLQYRSLLTVSDPFIIGLSKERPTLGDNTKAHIFGLCSENIPIKPRRSTGKVHEKRMKSTAFHDERPFARNCNPMFFSFVFWRCLIPICWR